MLKKIYHFYRDGFRSMVLGRTLWKIILIKLAVLLVLANFVLPNYLNRNFTSDTQRAEHVIDNLTVSSKTNGNEH
ncbi:DUF4492 domain-containing protein [Trichloromonas sp.]|uniref:DUF4492 domain-containing protein n=1 Tax=Trichloromonas sp. TaxID=3069249 RepID=UPI003D81A10F